MRVELPSPQLRDPRDGTVGHDNLLDAIDPSSLSEVDARLMETADRFIGVDAHLVMLRATTRTPSIEPTPQISPAKTSTGVTATVNHRRETDIVECRPRMTAPRKSIQSKVGVVR